MSLTYGFCLDELSGLYNSKQFSDAFCSVVGDGITPYGSQFAVTINGFTATVASGYALAAGRWVENDEPLQMSVNLPESNKDRTDALVAQVDYTTRKASIEILVDINPLKLPDSFHSDDEYSIFLYLIRVRRGATALTPEDITDLRGNTDMCGKVVPLSAIAGDVLYVYNFLLSGIDQKVARIISLSQALVTKANAEIAKLDAEIKKTGGGPGIGELQTVRNPPKPGWILCNGEDVPDGYPILDNMLSGTLPNISKATDRYRTYIYGGVSNG